MNVFVLIGAAAENCISSPLRCLPVYFVLTEAEESVVLYPIFFGFWYTQKWRYSNRVHVQSSKDVSNINRGVFL